MLLIWHKVAQLHVCLYTDNKAATVSNMATGAGVSLLCGLLQEGEA